MAKLRPCTENSGIHVHSRDFLPAPSLKTRMQINLFALTAGPSERDKDETHTAQQGQQTYSGIIGSHFLIMWQLFSVANAGGFPWFPGTPLRMIANFYFTCCKISLLLDNG